MPRAVDWFDAAACPALCSSHWTPLALPKKLKISTVSITSGLDFTLRRLSWLIFSKLVLQLQIQAAEVTCVFTGARQVISGTILRPLLHLSPPRASSKTAWTTWEWILFPRRTSGSQKTDTLKSLKRQRNCLLHQHVSEFNRWHGHGQFQLFWSSYIENQPKHPFCSTASNMASIFQAIICLFWSATMW